MLELQAGGKTWGGPAESRSYVGPEADAARREARATSVRLVPLFRPSTLLPWAAIRGIRNSWTG